MQRDPARSYANDYAYAVNLPTRATDPNGQYTAIYHLGQPCGPLSLGPEMAYPCVELGQGRYGIYWERHPKHKPKAPYVARPTGGSGCRSECYVKVYLPALKRKCKECFEKCEEVPVDASSPIDPTPIYGFAKCVSDCMRNAKDARVKSNINAHQEYLDAIKQCEARHGKG